MSAPSGQSSELEQLRAQVAALAEQVRRLSDQVEIMQVVAGYGPSVDSGSGAATAALWTQDGVFDAVGHRRMTGRGEIAAMVEDPPHLAMLEQGAGHVLTTPAIEVHGDTATGRSHALHLRWDAEAGRFVVLRLSANIWHLARTDAGWKIVERVNAPLDGRGAHRLFAEAAPSPAAPASSGGGGS